MDNKKKFYKKPIFVPLIIMLISFIILIIYTFIKGETEACNLVNIQGIPRSCSTNLENTFFGAIGWYWIIMGLMWAIFGISRAVSREFHDMDGEKKPKNNTNNIIIKNETRARKENKNLNTQSNGMPGTTIASLIFTTLCIIPAVIVGVEYRKPGVKIGVGLMVLSFLPIIIITIIFSVISAVMVNKGRHSKRWTEKKGQTLSIITIVNLIVSILELFFML